MNDYCVHCGAHHLEWGEMDQEELDILTPEELREKIFNLLETISKLQERLNG